MITNYMYIFLSIEMSCCGTVMDIVMDDKN